jgi:hypothetical protein
MKVNFFAQSAKIAANIIYNQKNMKFNKSDLMLFLGIVSFFIAYAGYPSYPLWTIWWSSTSLTFLIEVILLDFEFID